MELLVPLESCEHQGVGSSKGLKLCINLLLLKQKIDEGARQFASKQQLWEAILTSCKEIITETLQKLTSSMDARIVKLKYNCET